MGEHEQRPMKAGGRPPLPAARRRTVLVGSKLTMAEATALRAYADAHATTASALLRRFVRHVIGVDGTTVAARTATS